MNIKKGIFISVLVLICLTALIFAYVNIPNSILETDNPISQSTVQLPIVMYHSLSKSQSRLGDFVLSVDQFENDLKYIKSNGYTTVTCQQLINYVKKGDPLPENPIMITFDDGYENNYKYAFNLLKKYEMNAVLSIIGTCTEQFSCAEDHNMNYSHVTWNQVREMSSSGIFEIGNHTFDQHHQGGARMGMNKKTGEDYQSYKTFLEKDLIPLQKKIQEICGSQLKILAYPFGKYSSDTTKIVQELSFDITFGTYERVNFLTRDKSCLYNMRRVNRPHGISSEQFFAKIEKMRAMKY